VNTLSQVAIDPSGITVSGVSAGAYMAHQLLVAYSDVFSGLGAVAGGPFLCSKGTLHGALTTGMRGEGIDVAHLIRHAQSLEAKGLIASLDNLSRSRVWAFRGTRDTTVLKAPVDALVEFSRHFSDSSDIAYVDDIACRHTMPTDSFDRAAHSRYIDPYIDDVGYDAAGNMFRHLYGPLKARRAAQGSLVAFDQSEFLALPRLSGIDNTGFVYYPSAALRGERCKLHVALHGCEQHRARLGTLFAEHAGYNEWAEANDIVVLYPQAFPTITPFVFNPKGSWDWFGLVSSGFFTREGVQQKTIVEMVDRLTGHALFAPQPARSNVVALFPHETARFQPVEFADGVAAAA
jgi:poly(3-hydroxybutyrate) depolymerase